MSNHNISVNNFSSLTFDLQDPSSLSIFHLNIRSFNRNSDELTVYLSQLTVKPVVIVLTETWFGEDNVSELNGYNGHHVYRSDRRGGGVSIFVSVGIVCNSVNRLCYIGNNMEICTVNLGIRGIDLTVLGVYRPPDRDVHLFTDDINSILGEFRPRDRIVLVGDVNIDLLNPGAIEDEFIDMCTSNSFHPLISGATHISRFGTSCIDHIWYNQFDVSSSGIVELQISDHFAIFAVFPYSLDHQNFTMKRFRDHSGGSLRKLREHVNVFVNHFHVSDTDDINIKLPEFSDKLYRMYDDCCPLRSKYVSLKRVQKPWISACLVRCINRKHVLFRDYKMGLVTFDAYNLFKNFVTSLIRRTKSQYFISRFNVLNGDARKTWDLLGSMSAGRKKHSNVEQLVFRDRTLTEPKSIAEAFNSFFANIGKNLDDGIPVVPACPLDYMGEPSHSSFFVRPASPADVERLIGELPNKSCGLQSIPAFIYKFCKDLVSPVICALFNNSVNSGIFPDTLKIARVVPVFKAGDKHSVNNYRPISVLSIISKIFEKLMHNRLMTFVTNNDVLSKNQFGFRTNSCTSDAVLEFLDHAFTSLSNNRALMSVFLDFSKAFDTVNHNVLIKKLAHIGIRGVASRWFSSYLSDRRQYVRVGDSSSTVSEITVGVPQGSVLGPVLFLIYINDMSNCTTSLRFVHFADDTTAFHSLDNVEQLTEEVNGGLDALRTWLYCNRLSLNIGKTVYMLFTDMRIQMLPVVKIAGNPIQHVTESKFLGITVDSRLSFTPHANYVCRQISKSVGMLNRLSGMLPPRTKASIYYAIVYSRVSYGIVAWGSCGMNSTRKLTSMVRKAQRVVTYSGSGRMDGSIKMLTFNSIYKYFTAVKLYRTLRMGYHPHFSDLYCSLLPVHDYGTRFNNDLNLNTPLYSKTKCNRSFLYRSVNAWNSLPDDVKISCSLTLFKSKLKRWLISTQN